LSSMFVMYVFGAVCLFVVVFIVRR
jgi:hypothetical protein